jgi:hypothetical protein
MAYRREKSGGDGGDFLLFLGWSGCCGCEVEIECLCWLKETREVHWGRSDCSRVAEYCERVEWGKSA